MLFWHVTMSPETSAPLTLEEHRELGRELRVTSARLRELHQLLISVYGPQHLAAAEFRRVSEGLGRLRQDLQTQAAADLPGYPVDGLYL